MKKNAPFISLNLWKDSLILAFIILGGIETVMSVLAITLERIGNVPTRVGLVAIVYVVITIAILIIKHYLTKKEIKLYIRGMKVIIKQGDIFKGNGWKLIPFNEYFDTVVDDKIIAHNSLNGMLIDHFVDDIDNFKRELAADDSSPLAAQKRFVSHERWQYPLGTIKTYAGRYMSLALTHFNEQNEAHTTRAEYEQTLRIMWKEIGRVYAGKSINLPLIGAGLTRLDDMVEKPNTELLKCILCTLRTSSVILTESITILLTEKALETINLYELKGVK
jgi:hypothetical protein